MHGPRIGPKRASRGSEKSHLLGASPCSSTPQGGPLYGWKKRGILAVVVRARGVCGFASTYARCPHTRPRCLSPVEAEGCLLLIASVLRGQGTAWALRATQGTGPIESSMENPPPRPPVPKSVLSTLCGAESAAGQCGLGEIARSSEWQGGLLFPRTGAQGPYETAVTSQGWVT